MEHKTHEYTPESYMARWVNRRDYYAIMATRSRWSYQILQIFIITGAAVTPFLVNSASVPKIWPTVLSALVAVAAALNGFLRPKDNWRVFYQIFDGLRREKIQFDLRLGKYKGLSPEEAFEQFVLESDKLMNEEIKNTFGPESSKQE